jgi:steroid delta-isomerase-like uncharacterized protein
MVEHMDPNLLLSRLFDEAVNQGHIEVISKLYASNFIDHSPGPTQLTGPAGIVQVVNQYRNAIPDLKVRVEDVIVSGNRVATRETWRGTYMDELAGIPATGQQFTVTRMHIFRIEDGLIVEEWSAGSIIDMLRNAAG